MASTCDRPDILIIGGGVAGSGLATVLARAGLGVTVIERAREFRDRIRGESVHPWGAVEMRRAGLLDLAVDRAAAVVLPLWTRYADAEPGDPYRWSDDFPDAPGEVSVHHPALQDALIAAATHAGAEVLRPASVLDIDWPDGRPEVTVEADGRLATITPRLLVGADGSHSATRRALGGTTITDLPHHAIGGSLLHGIDLPADSAHQTMFAGGFAMVFPQRNGVSRVYYICTSEEAEAMRSADQPDALIERLAEVLPEGAVDRASAAGPTGFFPNSETLATVDHGPATVLIGDAAASNDPSQGHGLSLAFRDIRDLAERLTEHDWDDIPAAFAETRRRDHGVLRAHAQWVAPLSVGIGPKVDALRERVARSREADPSAGGFAGIFATGPVGLIADDAARRHFLGEDR